LPLSQVFVTKQPETDFFGKIFFGLLTGWQFVFTIQVQLELRLLQPHSGNLFPE
jgi:hypothetical protein